MINISTEKENKLTKNIDQQSIETILKVINAEDKKVPFAIENSIPSLIPFIKKVIACLKKDGRLIYVGAGTSGRIGIVDAADCVSTYGVEPNKIIGIISGGAKTFFEPMDNTEDDESMGKEYLEKIKVCDKDIILGISASGRTPFVIGALKFAKEKGAIIGVLSNSKNAEFNKYAKYHLFINTGPEVIAGSTRMKAATGQKLVLNMITTTAMIKLGKVYGNLMVDVLPNNAKLIERAISLIMKVTKVNRDIAKKAFEDSKMKAKVAIVMILLKVDQDEANRILDLNEGFLHRIIK